MRLRYTPRAQADLDIIFGFIDRQNPEAARTVKEIIERRIAWLADFPFIAPETSKDGVRELTASTRQEARGVEARCSARDSKGLGFGVEAAARGGWPHSAESGS